VKNRSKFALLVAATSVAMFAFSGASYADPPSELISPPNHRHFLRMPDGSLVPVGPQICLNPNLQTAFNEFHYNIHAAGGAPGLHNHDDPDVVAVPGC
jgi:hypothetical protein